MEREREKYRNLIQPGCCSVRHLIKPCASSALQTVTSFERREYIMMNLADKSQNYQYMSAWMKLKKKNEYVTEGICKLSKYTG